MLSLLEVAVAILALETWTADGPVRPSLTGDIRGLSDPSVRAT
jgi:hypothetical protein